MKHNRTLTLLLSFPLALGGAGALHAQDAPLNLTLKDAIRQVVQKNLDVQVELYNPAIAQADIGKNLAIFDPVLTAQASYDRTENPSASTVFIGVPRQDTVSLDLGASKLF